MKRENAGYSRLKMKIMLQMLGMIAGAFVLILAVYNLVWAGRGADFMVSVFQHLLGMDYGTARNVYWTVFRDNAVSILLVAGALAFCGYLYFFITRFTRYFGEINKGVDALLEEGEGEIRLSAEMAPMQDKLNTVRRNLAGRAAAVKEAEERKNNLVMYLAHDIRTPLTSVIGYLSLLDEAPDMPAAQKAKYVHITLDKAIRLEHLVNEFFEITRYNSQHLVLQKESIDLHYMLLQLLDEFYPILAEKEKTAVLRADENLTVCADATKLARVLGNLLKNAAAYGNPGTEILVCAARRQGVVEISFQNEGADIPPEKLGTLFDRFYRLDESRASDTGGAGLGLPIAKDIVQAHGGSIAAESENGLVRFIVRLPDGQTQGQRPGGNGGTN